MAALFNYKVTSLNHKLAMFVRYAYLTYNLIEVHGPIDDVECEEGDRVRDPSKVLQHHSLLATGFERINLTRGHVLLPRCFL